MRRGTIPALDHDDEKEETKVKSHHEIAELLDELATLEEHYTKHEFNQAVQAEYKSILQPEEPQAPPAPVHEPSVEDQKQAPPPEKKPRFFSVTIHRKHHTKPPKLETHHRRIFFRRTQKELPHQPETSEDQPPLAETVQKTKRVKPIKGTFTLTIDDDGNLHGFRMKKPHPEKEKRSWHLPQLPHLPLRRKKSETTEGEEPTEKTGIPAKIKGLFLRFRREKSEEETESKISGLIGKLKGIAPKIKGIIPRRSKE